MIDEPRRRIPAPGSRVRLRVGAETVVGTVVEYRGDRGNGPEIAVRFRRKHGADLLEIEVPVDEVTLVESPH